jgi:DNA replication protein DnaC
MTACQKGYSVLFTTAMDMVNRLQAAHSDATLVKALRQYARPQILVLDELGYLPIDKQGADLIFQVVSQRYERGSIVLTTNRPPKEWDKVFNDATVASAVLDRLAHHSEIVVIDGKSFRTQRENPSAE